MVSGAEGNLLILAAAFACTLWLGLVVGYVLGAGVADYQYERLRKHVQDLKTRWWAAFRNMVETVESGENDPADYWKHDRDPPGGGDE